MKYLFLLFFLNFYFWSIGQSKFNIDETTYLLDDSLVFVRFDMKPLNGILLDHASREIGLYVNGKREGVHIIRYDNDNILVKAEYKYNTLNGQYKKFFSNGKLMEESVYDLGVMDGISRSYHKNGKLKTEDYYNHGIRHGLCRKWWGNGQLAVHKKFNSDQCILHKEWDRDGRKIMDKVLVKERAYPEENIIEVNKDYPPPPDIPPPPPPPPVETIVEEVAAPIVEFPDVEPNFPCGTFYKRDTLGNIIDSYELCGPMAMQRWINDNIKYPQTSIEMNEQGRVFLSFVVETNGSISNVKIERGISIDLDREAKRVIKKMPKWVPGESAGRAVRARCRLPINFQLQ